LRLGRKPGYKGTMRVKRILASLIVIAGLGGAGFLAFPWPSAIDPAEPPARSSFDPALIAKGEQLATLGNCRFCHTVPGGQDLAGGRPLQTPFGIIYTTNITPDRETGLGLWSEAAFTRAMREGIDRQGRHLYPAFPYHHFTRLTDDDIAALYAFLMTRKAVRAVAPPNELPFPFTIRALIAVWNLLFLEKGAVEEDPSRSALWNRGAYLVEGLGHCGGCHTPFNLLGAEKRSEKFAGGQSEGWDAPALNARSTAPVPWTRDRLYAYLRDGWDDQHGMAMGPMAAVSHNLAQVPEQDVRAIATYIASFMDRPERPVETGVTAPEARRTVPGPLSPGHEAVDRMTGSLWGRTGAAIFAGACARCHGDQGRGGSGIVPFFVSTTVAAKDPDNLIRIVLQGVERTEHPTGRTMPPFADIFSDQQIAAVTAYIRARFADRSTQRTVENDVRRIRRQIQTSMIGSVGRSASPDDDERSGPSHCSGIPEPGPATSQRSHIPVGAEGGCNGEPEPRTNPE